MSICDKPLVSVVVLSYNNFKYIKDCILSILKQEYPNIELIISDDGSKYFDKEFIINIINKNRTTNLKGYTITVNEENLGTSKNFNKALSLAKGMYIKYIAADDLFYSRDSLNQLVNIAIEEDSNVVIARSPNYDMYLEKREWIFPSDYHWQLLIDASKDMSLFFSIMSPYCLISAPSVLFKREFLITMGGADESYRIIEDWPLWLKMIRHNLKFTFLNEPVTTYRSGGVSNGENNEYYGLHQIEFADVIKNECLKYPENFSSRKLFKIAENSERRHRRDGEKRLSEVSWFTSIKYIDVLLNELKDNVKSYIFSLIQKKRIFVAYSIIIMFLLSITNFFMLLSPFMSAETVAYISNLLEKIIHIYGIGIFTIGLFLYAFSFLFKIKELGK